MKSKEWSFEADLTFNSERELDMIEVAILIVEIEKFVRTTFPEVKLEVTMISGMVNYPPKNRR